MDFYLHLWFLCIVKKERLIILYPPIFGGIIDSLLYTSTEMETPEKEKVTSHY